MRLYEIIGNTSDEVFNRIIKIKAVLISSSSRTRTPSVQLERVAKYYTGLLYEDPDNLTRWVLKDPNIEREYNKIPAKYRKL